MAGKIENQIQTIEPVKPKHLRCIVKLGGAAITRKNELETIHEENLRLVCRQLREAMMRNSASGVVGMDWSRRRDADLPVVTEIDEDWALDLDNEFIVVHGAGSFGHFQASRSGVHKGGLRRPFVKAGFVATRISVTSLNLEIVRALAREGVPSVGLSPFANGWTTNRRNIASADISQVAQALYAGFVPRVAPVCSVREPITEINDLPIGFSSCGKPLPRAKVHEAQFLLPEQLPINNVKTSPSHAKVLHGDAVLDDCQDCTILSGDVIIRHLARQFLPEYVVFLTDVLGVYDRPPTDSSAILLREIAVDEDGNWSIIKPMLEDSNKQVEITIAAHDTTGGMETKISEAAEIARLGIDVYITKAGTEHSLRALMGKVSSIPDDWLGTVIRSSKGNHPSK